MATIQQEQQQQQQQQPPTSNVVPNSNLPWYRQDYGDRLTPPSKEVFLNYSKIPEADLEEHIKRVRDQGYSIFPFPCIGEFWFLVLGLSEHPRYKDIVHRLTNYPTTISTTGLIDIGTGFGQDLRKLIYDGAYPSQIMGFDQIAPFEGIGHALYNDAATFSGRFQQGDIFSDAPDSVFTKDKGKWEIVASSMFLHSFTLEQQVVAAEHMLKLAQNPGGWLVGCLTGTTEAKSVPLKPPFVPEGSDRSFYLHDKASLTKLWEDAQESTGLKLKIWVEYDVGEGSNVSKVAASAGVSIFANLEQKHLWYWVEIEG